MFCQARQFDCFSQCPNRQLLTCYGLFAMMKTDFPKNCLTVCAICHVIVIDCSFYRPFSNTVNERNIIGMEKHSFCVQTFFSLNCIFAVSAIMFEKKIYPKKIPLDTYNADLTTPLKFFGKSTINYCSNSEKK